MKNNRYSSDPLTPVSFTMLTTVAESTPSLASTQGNEQMVEQVVFEVELVKIFNDRAIGKIWFLGTSAQEKVKQGEGVVILPIQPDAARKKYAIQAHEATVVANTYNDFGDIIDVVQGMLTIESLSTDDTAIKTGFGRIMVSRISLNKESPADSGPANVPFVH